MSKKIGVIVGSLRANSFSGSIANYVKDHAPEGLSFEVIDISSLPLYNQDYDGESPAAYESFRAAVKGVDGLLFITPEHNRSIPAALKNALDVGSRPYGQSVWSGKPGAIISQSPGGIGGFGANHHLRQVLTFLNVLTLAQPEAYLGAFHTALNEKGEVVNPDTQNYLNGFLAAFAAWVNKLA